MLKNSLIHIPQIVLLRSDKLLTKLLYELINTKQVNVKDNFNSFFDGVKDFYPNSYRLDEIELSLSQKEITSSGISSDFNFKEFDGLNYNFSFLNKIFKSFFTFDGSKIYAKEDNLEEYLRFITKISPLQIIGYKLSKELFNNKIELNDLFSFIDNYTPLGLRVDKQNKYAENHLHLKGSSYISFNLSRLFTFTTNKKYFDKEYLHELPRINEFSYINNQTYSIGQIVEIAKLSIDFIYGSFMDNELDNSSKYIENLNKILSINKPLNIKYSYSIDTISKMSNIFPVFKNNIKDNITREIVRLYNKELFARAHLLEYSLFFYIYKKTKSNYLKLFIKLYFQIANILRSYMVMSQNQGLAHFSEFSGSDIRQVDKHNANSIASGIIKSGTNYLNAKMDVKKQPNKISEILQDFNNAFEYKDSKFKHNYGLSTKKGREKDIKIQIGNLHPRFYKRSQDIKSEALALDDFIRNIKYKKIDMFSNALKYTKIKAYENKSKLKDKIFDISSYVVSIDAVGKETHTPPEIFAPYFKYLRYSPKKLKNDIFLGTKVFSHHPKLIITAHAGEDFNHIITGMRRVDESVKFFGMHRRDRLGHVLSLGFFPKDWLDITNDILVYQGDYFDDLVWLCVRLKKIENINLDIVRIIKIYEDRVWKLFSKLYPMCKRNIQIQDMYQAWKYRENCSISYYKRKINVTQFDDYSRIVLDKKPSKNVQEIYELYQTNKKVRENYKKVIKIDKKNISKIELKIWEALQDKMINELSKKGIIIETNPSSNVFVSSIDSYDYHPIFRFYPPKSELLKKGKKFNKFNQRDGRIAVTINSDDPAIFVTTLQNEYRTIKNIAINKYKCSDKEAEDWIEDIRKFGVKIFKESYIENK